MSVADKLTTIAENIHKVYDAGYEKARYLFWHSLTNGGTKTAWQTFFTSYWTDESFRPIYDFNVKGEGAKQMFVNSSIVNLKGVLEECGVVLNTSEGTYFTQMFQTSKVEYIPTLDMSNAVNTSYMFGASSVKAIEKLIVTETVPWSNTFINCAALEEITFEGVIAQNGLNLQWSTKLSKESITSIINALSPSTSGLTVTLSNAAVMSAFDSSYGALEELISSKPNWTISLI